MDNQQALFQSELPHLQLLNRGKVRDLYIVDDAHLLIVTTDRISAYDVVFSQPIPGKGAVLTGLSNFWFQRTQNFIPNHLTEIPLNTIILDSEQRQILENRAIIVQRLTPLPIEAVVRGYLIGSGWKDYQRTGSVCGLKLPTGLQLAERLTTPLFTPSTKAAIGDHDENVDFDYTIALLGNETANQVRDMSLRIYQECSVYAQERGIIIADTKFEFGHDETGRLVLIDELLTPDSSRFWPMDKYQPGQNPPSFDKQFVRDYLETIGWNKTPPAPILPETVITQTAQNYQEAAQRLIS
ncbi:phosphoribosylaminoimidazole-succinocarboxamide synthase [Achromatium sp. WMS3]|nr:phosphoribosylaminoimidazole-succinocarboxamide synthase [Achromatium sp. WMS3]